jgi:hypothetical protein
MRIVFAQHCGHRIPPNVRDDGQRPSQRGEIAESVMLLLANREAIYFLAHDWTVDSALIAFCKFDFWRNAVFVIPGWSDATK